MRDCILGQAPADDQQAAPAAKGHRSEQDHALADHILHFPSSFNESYLAAFTERLRELEVYKVKHTMIIQNGNEVEVSSRPKLVFGVRDKSGSFPLYRWGQILKDFAEIGDMPAFAQQFMDVIQHRHADLLQQPCGNHFLITYSTQIPPHNDKRFNARTAPGGKFKPEGEAPLLLFTFGADTILTMTGKGGKVVREICFNHGSFVYIPGFVNASLKHSVKAVGVGFRASVVIRDVDAYHVNPVGHFYMDGEKRIEVPPGTWSVRQPCLPEQLAAALPDVATQAEAQAGLTKHPRTLHTSNHQQASDVPMPPSADAQQADAEAKHTRHMCQLARCRFAGRSPEARSGGGRKAG